MQLPTISLALLTLLSSVPVTVYAQGPADNYVPQIFGKPQGLDLGNKACVGNCVSDPNLLLCERKEYKPKYGCFMCCISDDDLERVGEESFIELDGPEHHGQKHDGDGHDDEE